MRMTARASIGGLALALVALPAFAGERIEYDFFGLYLRRIESINPSAGDAKSANAATHVIDPWPRYVTNRRIPGNGERMVGAVERYRDVSKLRLAPPPLAPVQIETSGFSSSSSSSSSGASAAPAAR